MKRLSPTLIAFVLYLLIAVVVTYPLIVKLSSALVGYVHGDGYEMAHHLWWFKHALQTGQNPFFAAQLGYPDGIDAVTLWTDPLQFFPAWLLAFVLPLPAAANVTILLTLALNGAAMFWLTKKLTAPQPPLLEERRQGDMAAFLAGLIFMLYPTMQGHLGAGHAGLLVQWGVPILIYALYGLRDSRRFIPLAALGIVLCVGGHTLQLIYVVLPLCAVFALVYLRDRPALLRLIAAGMIGGAVVLILALPAARSVTGTTAYAETGDTVRYSADLLAVVTPSFNHPLFGRLAYTHRVLGVNLDEGAAYSGVIAAILAGIALLRVRRARLWGGIALLAWVLSLGVLLKVFDRPVLIDADGYRSSVALPFALVADLPIFTLARTPGRFNFLLAAAVAIMAGCGAGIVERRIKRPALRLIVFALIGAGIAFEYQTFFPLPLIDADIPAGVAALADRDDVRAVFSAPWDNLIAAKTDLYWHTAHQLPLIAGQITRQTPVNPAKLDLLQTFDPALLRAAGADVVLIHRAYDDGSLERAARAQLGAPSYEDERVALFNTPAASTPEFRALLPPEGAIENTADTALYAPENGWALFTAALTGTDRAVTLLLNNTPVQRWRVGGETPISVPLPVSGYASIRLALDPPCPLNIDPSLECRSVDVAAPSVEFTAAAVGTVAAFERGVALANSYVPNTLNAGESLSVWLDWRFGGALDENDVRYVHVVDAAGTLVGQQDNPLGNHAAGSTWTESVTIRFEQPLAAGEYRVFVGWYVYPEIAPFCVLNANGACGDQRDVQMGAFRVGE
jgi:hypothetical protein